MDKSFQAATEAILSRIADMETFSARAEILEAGADIGRRLGLNDEAQPLADLANDYRDIEIRQRELQLDRVSIHLRAEQLRLNLQGGGRS